MAASICKTSFVCDYIRVSCIYYLQQLKGSQEFPGSAVPSVNLVVLQLWWEPRGAVVLVTHLDGGFRKRPTYELCLALNAILQQQAVETARGQGTGVRHGCGRCSYRSGHLVSVWVKVVEGYKNVEFVKESL